MQKTIGVQYNLTQKFEICWMKSLFDAEYSNVEC